MRTIAGVVVTSRTSSEFFRIRSYAEFITECPKEVPAGTRGRKEIKKTISGVKKYRSWFGNDEAERYLKVLFAELKKRSADRRK